MRSLPRRLTALMLGLWFALYLGVPQLVHPCPEHAAATEVASAAGHAAHHGPGATTTGSPAHGGETSAPVHFGNGCCCPGAQCGAGAMTLTSPTILYRSTVSLVGAVVRSWHENAPSRHPDFFIPFGTAPPAASPA